MSEESIAGRQRCGYPIVRSLGPETDLVIDERGRELVVKRLSESCLLQGELHPAILERLQRIRELPLRGIANFHGVQRDVADSFLIWSFIPGQPLNENTFDRDDTGRHAIIRDLRFVIDALHAAGIVHGAVHPGNIIIDRSGALCVTHISPLLFYDPAIDRAAIDKLERETTDKTDDPTIIQMIHARAPQVDYHRFALIGGSVGLMLLGGVVVGFIYWWTR